MDKAPDAFRTISEVADDLDVPQHVLRFWESRFPQIKPMKRGGGRRYYRPDDVALLRGIRHLLYGEGYTIRGVQRILREQGGQFVQSCWQEGAEKLDKRAFHAADSDEEEAGEELEAAETEANSDDETEADEAGPKGGRIEPRLDGIKPPRRTASADGHAAGAADDRRTISPEDLAKLRRTLDGLIEAREKLNEAISEAG